MRFILWLSTTDLIQLTVLAIGGILLTDTIFYKKKLTWALCQEQF